MRKNNVDRKNSLILSRLNAFVTYEIRGLNLDRFINYVKKQGITLYDIKKTNNKRLTLRVKYAESKKFFAIGKKLCYNIKKVGNSGRDYPVLYYAKRLGLIIGVLFFMAITVFCNDLVLSIDYVGTGSVYRRDVEEFLHAKNIDKYSRFSSFNLGRLEDEILAFNDNLSFVSCVKNGSRLRIELVLFEKKVETLDGNVYAFYAECDGEIETLKVYRGTAIVKKGDKVKSGDLLIDGYAVIKEQRVEINVLALVSVITEKEISFVFKEDGQEIYAEILAKEQCSQEDIVSVSVKKQKRADEYVYTATVKTRRIYHVG